MTSIVTRTSYTLWLVAGVLSLSSLGLAESSVRAERFEENPLITVDSSPSLGDNVNGPSLIRVPDWVTNPLGRYYLYFAHHKGHHIRLAYADSIRGPWKIYEPGVLAVADTAFKRPVPEPDPDVPLYLHVASPDVHIDDQNKRIVMFVHGRWTDGKSVPGFDTRAEYTDWAAKNDYGQRSQSATSDRKTGCNSQRMTSWRRWGTCGALYRGLVGCVRGIPGLEPGAIDCFALRAQERVWLICRTIWRSRY